MYQDDLKKILGKANPEKGLRNFALKLHQKKLSRKEVYYIFYDYYTTIIDAENQQSSIDILGDVMDMIWGSYSGKNIDFENEKYDSRLDC